MGRSLTFSSSSSMVTLTFFLCFSASLISIANGNAVFEVSHRFKGHDPGTVLMKQLTENQANRRRLLTTNVEVPVLGTTGDWSVFGLHYANMTIGGTSYLLCLDTGNAWLWVNGRGCKGCPSNSTYISELTRYDEKKSNSSSRVSCDDPFCAIANPDGCLKDCTFNLSNPIGDAGTVGYYVRDTFQFSGVALGKEPVTAEIVFGVGMEQRGTFTLPDTAYDGVLGLKATKTSFVGQLASSKVAANAFSLCLDPMNGGVFVLGDVVEPKVTKTTPLLLNATNGALAVNVTGIDVGGNVLEIPSDIFEFNETQGAFILNTQTAVYVPEAAFNAVKKELETRMKVKTTKYQFLTCLNYPGNNGSKFGVDAAFPDVTFHFDGSLGLTLRPSEYLTWIMDVGWCLNIVSSGDLPGEMQVSFFFGESAMGNKLMVFDIDNQAVGWVSHNCTMGVKVQDDNTGGVYNLKPSEVSGHVGQEMGMVMLMVVVVSTMLHYLIL